MPQPLPDQEDVALYEKEIVDAGESDVAHLAEEWDRLDTKLLTNYCKAVAQKQNLVKAHKKETDEALEAKKKMSEIKEKLDSFQHPGLSKTWEMILLTFFAVVEVPFLLAIYEIFGFNRLESLLIAIGTATAISAMAFFLGRLIKFDPKTLTDKIWIISILILVFGSLIGVAMARSALFSKLQSGKKLLIDMDPSNATLLFVFVNLTVFAVGTLVTAMATRPNHKDWKSTLDLYKEAKNQYKSELEEAEEATEALAKSEERLMEAMNLRKKQHDTYCEKARTIAQLADLFIRTYRRENMGARRDGTIPPCFKKEPEKILIPKSFTENSLSWNCDRIAFPDVIKPSLN